MSIVSEERIGSDIREMCFSEVNRRPLLKYGLIFSTIKKSMLLNLFLEIKPSLILLSEFQAYLTRSRLLL